MYSAATELPQLRFEIIEAARILRLSRATLYERIRAGEIKAQKDQAEVYHRLWAAEVRSGEGLKGLAALETAVRPLANAMPLAELIGLANEEETEACEDEQASEARQALEAQEVSGAG